MSVKDFDIQHFDTDKIGYLEYYNKVFSPIKNNVKKMLELGIYHGGSLQMWEKFFTKADIIGVDIEKIDVPNSGRVKIYQGDQKDTSLLNKITGDCAPEGFDIIIDDASHFGKETFISFIYLFKNSLKSKGVYVIEDWGTGYWPHFPDGRNITLDKHHVSYHLHTDTDYDFKQKGLVSKGPFLNNRRFQSHDYGMVGLIKQIIDELAIEQATLPQYTNKESTYKTFIENILITPGQCFIFKK